MPRVLADALQQWAGHLLAGRPRWHELAGLHASVHTGIQASLSHIQILTSLEE